MRQSIFLVLWAVLALTLAGAPEAGAARYPQKITGVPDSSEYPLRAAGFERTGFYRYQPGDADISVGYNMFTPETNIVSTIYITNGSVFPGLLREDDPVAALFNDYKTSTAQYHAGARLLGEDSVVLKKNGKNYKALRVFFQYEADFMSKRQPVFSVMMLWRNGDDFIKLRSTMPIAQRDQWETRNMDLLDAVDWTKRPF